MSGNCEKISMRAFTVVPTTSTNDLQSPKNRNFSEITNINDNVAWSFCHYLGIYANRNSKYTIICTIKNGKDISSIYVHMYIFENPHIIFNYNLLIIVSKIFVLSSHHDYNLTLSMIDVNFPIPFKSKLFCEYRKRNKYTPHLTWVSIYRNQKSIY